jgi:hypothetical protein
MGKEANRAIVRYDNCELKKEINDRNDRKRKENLGQKFKMPKMRSFRDSWLH